MRKIRLHVPEIRDKFRRLFLVDSTKTRPTTVKVKMDMEHRYPLVVRSLKGFSNCMGAHGRSRGRVIEIVSIFDIVQTMRQDHHAAVLEQASAT